MERQNAALLLSSLLLLCGLASPLLAAEEKAPKSKKASKSSPRTQGIQKLGEGKYRISETEFYRLLGSMAFLSKQARLRPVIRNKVVAGYQIYKIRKKSVFDRLGLKDGDRLERINGIPLDGARRKNQLLAQAQKADRIELVLRRKGKRITLVYLLGPKPPPRDKKSAHP